jgi:hypothetical protein
VIAWTRAEGTSPARRIVADARQCTVPTVHADARLIFTRFARFGTPCHADFLVPYIYYLLILFETLDMTDFSETAVTKPITTYVPESSASDNQKDSQ